MRHFGTHGPVNIIDNYVVARTEKLDDFIKRVKLGRYIVLFAPRQTGKTTFFQDALTILKAPALQAEDTDYFPIQLNFQDYGNLTLDAFYTILSEELPQAINRTLQMRGELPARQLENFLENPGITDNIAMRRFFEKLPTLLVAEETAAASLPRGRLNH